MATGRTSNAWTSPSGSAHRAAGVGLLLVGATVLAMGAWGLLVAILDVPSAVVEAVTDGWTALLVVGGVWAARQGRRTLGVGFVALGAVIAVTRHVPEDLIWPVLVIGAGIAVIAGATGRGRQYLRDGSGIAAFGDRHPLVGADGAQALIAVFGDVDGELEDEAPAGVVACLAVFGTVELVVPRDAVVEMQQTSVFGDVRAPAPPSGRVGTTVRVRGTAIFGGRADPSRLKRLVRTTRDAWQRRRWARRLAVRSGGQEAGAWRDPRRRPAAWIWLPRDAPPRTSVPASCAVSPPAWRTRCAHVTACSKRGASWTTTWRPSTSRAARPTATRRWSSATVSSPQR